MKPDWPGATKGVQSGQKKEEYLNEVDSVTPI